MKDGFIRAAAATPDIKVADCGYNADRMIELINEAAEKDISLLVFPELCITGYTCGDLFLHNVLLESAEKALMKICEASKDIDMLIMAGLPVSHGGRLYNCAAVLKGGKVLGLVPKINIPNYSEFYEARHFTSGRDVSAHLDRFGGTELGRMLFESNIPGFTVGAEICEDVWVVSPPSNELAAAGATVICNLSASDEVIGKGEYRRQLIKGQSARLICGYIYADAGLGESTQDMVFCGHNLICDNGALVAESKKFTTGLTYTEIDVSRIDSERRRMSTFPKQDIKDIKAVKFELAEKTLQLTRQYAPMPFVPADQNDLDERCEEILSMQATGLLTRLRHIGCKNVVLGLSGGLDSTLALIVTVHAFDMLGLDRNGIITVTMPCFGTTHRTKSNACELAKAYGVQLREVNITASVKQHFADIGQSEEVHDVTYENGQARERTQVLMDIANKENGIVIGTGDLSELALGWATYNGDHMSMYGVNASVPKTLVRHLVSYEMTSTDNILLAAVLEDILNTPVSPELLPPTDDEISQKTEDIVGPYELHDFFLYYFVRCTFSPSKILRIAEKSFADKYKPEVIKKWLDIFMRRFFSQQFKRSCLPDSPKVGSVTLSPRGDFRMPSDASRASFLL